MDVDPHNETEPSVPLEPAQGLRASPVLLVRDIIPAAEYYRDRLGFTDLVFYGKPECFCTLRLGAAMLMLSQPQQPTELRPNFRLGHNSIDLHLLVDDARRQHAFCLHNAADIVVPLRQAPYGMLEFIVRDLDGYGILIGQNM